ncbi:hypothetical protein BWK62_03650 [Flavobacterium oreochromis]|uniref:Uncharacterized protein n=1 Tax=Flavobacterium columnare TaxID=996 RepID=A0A246GD47_9FLAO|nr:hypothetical protein BWG23_05140 [Flavobacterium oreochromis]OWP79229.1 hypothetical protein BWK62_03650 [Flavobacterium oreochromis]POR21070.1 hypothetical protein BWK58_12985 [Flavobacterium columnare]
MLVLISNTGLAINVHYCGEVIAAITFDNLKKDSSSSCCGNKIVLEDSCCKDKKVEIKNSTSENVLIKSFELKLPVFIPKDELELVFNDYAMDKIIVDNLPAYYCNTHAPPFYKLYSQLLFYA